MKKLIVTVIILLSSLQVVYSQSGWFIQSSGTLPRIWDSYFIDADTGYAVGVSTIIKTTDGGENWIFLNHGTYFLLWCVQFTNPSNGFAGGQYLIKTTNSGLNWQTTPNELFVNSMFFLNSNTGWIGSNQGQINKTTNNGENWIICQINNATTITDIYFCNANKGWCVSGYGNIYGTENGGINWTLLDSTESDLNEIQFVDENIGWVAGEEILKTTNGGINWFLQTYGYTYQLKDIYFVNSLTGYCVGQYGTIVKTTNGGINWFLQISGVTDLLNSIQFVDMNTGWAIGYSYGFYGTILKTTDGGSTFVSKTNNEILGYYSLHQNYPNPFNPTTKIKFDLPKSTQAKLVIYDILGREVATLVNERLNAGSYEVEWSASNYSSGVYFYRLETNDYSSVKKMLMIK